MASRRLTVALAVAVSGAAWAVFLAPGSNVSAAPADGVTTRTSVADGDPGAQAPDGGSQTVISGNGRYEAFVSTDDLSSYYRGTDGNNGNSAVFVRDASTGSTVQISVSTSGASGNTTPDGGGITDGSSYQPSISYTGRYVAFLTTSQNIVGQEGFDFLQAIVVCDRDPDGDGTFDEPAGDDDFPTMRCIKIKDDFQSQDISTPEISGDGHEVVWSEPETNLQTEVTHDFVETVHLRDDANGQLIAPTAGDFHTLSLDVPTLGVSDLTAPAVSVQANDVVYTGEGSDGVTGIFETALDSDGNPGTTVRVDRTDSGGQAYVGTDQVRVGEATVSGDGGIVAFSSAGDVSALAPQVWLYNDVGSYSTRVSLTRSGQIGDGIEPALSGDGRYLSFVTDRADMTNAVPQAMPPNQTCINPKGVGITGNTTPCQVVVSDIDRYLVASQTGLPTQLASSAYRTDCEANPPADTQCVGDGDSSQPSLSDNGNRVAWTSDADDLVAGDTNRICDESCQESCENQPCGTAAPDAFVRTWTPTLQPDSDPFHAGQVRVGRHATNDFAFTAHGFGPVTAADVSFSGPDAADFTIEYDGCVQQDLHDPTECPVDVTFRPTTPGVKTATMTVTVTNGRQTSDDGSEVDGTRATVTVPVTGTGLPPVDAVTTNIVRTSVGSGNPGAQAPTGSAETSMVSGNGRYDVFLSTADLDGRKTDGHQNVYVRDLRTHRTQQISLAADVNGATGAVRPNGGSPDNDSHEPSISADGRFVSFATEADDIVPADGSLDVTVVCDRDPDGDGVFDEQVNGVPDFRCIDVDAQPVDLSADPTPRLAPDGKHIVWEDCIASDGSCRTQTELAGFTFHGTALSGITTPQPVPDTITADGDPSQSQPQVSDEHTVKGQNTVRVAFATALNEIVATDVSGTSAVSHRVDVEPPGAEDFPYVGQDDAGLVANPSMSDDGSRIAFDSTSSFDGYARSYVVDVAPDGRASSQFVSVTNAGLPVRAADPALSGDGRYVSYVTDTPEFDGSPQTVPDESCLHPPDDEAPSDPTDYTPCQIVARDLVTDRAVARAGDPPLPDMLVTQSGQQPPPCSARPTMYGSTCGGDGDSYDPSMSGIGARVGFDSPADDLVANDTNDSDVDSTPPQPSAQDAFVASFTPTVQLTTVDGQTSVDFGAVELGQSGTMDVVASVDGFGPYQLQQDQVTGSDAGDFTAAAGTCSIPGTALGGNDTCTIGLTFTPSALGARQAELTVTGTDNPNSATIGASGTGTRTPPMQPQISTRPDQLRFGSDIPLHTPGRLRVLTIHNPSGTDLAITAVQLVDSSVPGAARDYTVEPCAKCSAGFIPPGGSWHLKIDWIGQAVGSRPAVLRITSNAPGTVDSVNLRATVPAPKIALSPSVVATGHLTQVSGTGFAPHRRVLVTLPDNAGSAIATTTRHGHFSAALIVFPNGVTGPSRVLARSAHADASIKAGKKFLITLGTLESPTLVIRH